MLECEGKCGEAAKGRMECECGGFEEKWGEERVKGETARSVGDREIGV